MTTREIALYCTNLRGAPDLYRRHAVAVLRVDWRRLPRLALDRSGLDRAAPRIMSEAFSPIIIAGAFVLPRTIVGMTDASTTRRPWTPGNRSRLAVTAVA
jgi:hypothetical protein